MFVLMYDLILLGGEGLEAEGTVEGAVMVMGYADVSPKTVLGSELFPARRFRALHYNCKGEKELRTIVTKHNTHIFLVSVYPKR